jgi:hypothetical protein
MSCPRVERAGAGSHFFYVRKRFVPAETVSEHRKGEQAPFRKSTRFLIVIVLLCVTFLICGIKQENMIGMKAPV